MDGKTVFEISPRQGLRMHSTRACRTCSSVRISPRGSLVNFRCIAFLLVGMWLPGNASHPTGDKAETQPPSKRLPSEASEPVRVELRLSETHPLFSVVQRNKRPWYTRTAEATNSQEGMNMQAIFVCILTSLLAGAASAQEPQQFQREFKLIDLNRA
jgi:hypothetical protein